MRWSSPPQAMAVYGRVVDRVVLDAAGLAVSAAAPDGDPAGVDAADVVDVVVAHQALAVELQAAGARVMDVAVLDRARLDVPRLHALPGDVLDLQAGQPAVFRVGQFDGAGEVAGAEAAGHQRRVRDRQRQPADRHVADRLAGLAADPQDRLDRRGERPCAGSCPGPAAASRRPCPPCGRDTIAPARVMPSRTFHTTYFFTPKAPGGWPHGVGERQHVVLGVVPREPRHDSSHM